MTTPKLLLAAIAALTLPYAAEANTRVVQINDSMSEVLAEGLIGLNLPLNADVSRKLLDAVLARTEEQLITLKARAVHCEKELKNPDSQAICTAEGASGQLLASETSYGLYVVLTRHNLSGSYVSEGKRIVSVDAISCTIIPAAIASGDPLPEHSCVITIREPI